MSWHYIALVYFCEVSGNYSPQCGSFCCGWLQRYDLLLQCNNSEVDGGLILSK